MGWQDPRWRSGDHVVGQPHRSQEQERRGIVYEQLTEREPEYSWIQYATTPEFTATHNLMNL